MMLPFMCGWAVMVVLSVRRTLVPWTTALPVAAADLDGVVGPQATVQLLPRIPRSPW